MKNITDIIAFCFVLLLLASTNKAQGKSFPTDEAELNTILTHFKIKHPQHYSNIESHLSPIEELCHVATKLHESEPVQANSKSLLTVKYLTANEIRAHKAKTIQREAISKELKRQVNNVSRRIKIQTHWYFSLSTLTFHTQLKALGIQDPGRIKNMILKSTEELKAAVQSNSHDYLKCQKLVRTFLGKEGSI